MVDDWSEPGLACRDDVQPGPARGSGPWGRHRVDQAVVPTAGQGSGRYRTAGVVLEVDGLEVLPFSAVTDEDVAASGETDREALRARAAHAGPVHEDTLVHRVEFHVVQPPAP